MFAVCLLYHQYNLDFKRKGHNMILVAIDHSIEYGPAVSYMLRVNSDTLDPGIGLILCARFP